VITSLLCYVTIWNSPADVTGTGIVDDAAKKDDKGNGVIGIVGFLFLLVNQNILECVYVCTLKVLSVLLKLKRPCV